MRVWRRWLLALCAFAVAVWGVNIGELYTTAGSLGAFHIPTGTPFVTRLLVGKGTAAYRAGVRTGDEVDVRMLPAAERYRFLNRVLAGSRMEFPILRQGRMVRITVVAGRPSNNSWWVLLGRAGGLWIALFAALLAWRRSDSIEARVLVIMLALFTLSNSLQGEWATPWLPLDIAANFVAAFATFAPSLLAVYALQFARPVSRTRRILTWLTYASAGASTVLSLLNFAATLPTGIDPFAPIFTSPSSIIAQGSAFLGLPLLCVLAAIHASRGNERARLIWATVPIGVFYAGEFVGAVLLSGIANFTSGAELVAFQNVAAFLLPLGLTYSLLSRRILDVGFALNRAAVFSGVSIVIVGAFVLVEWALSEWFAGASHSANIAVSAALALVLGLSVRAVHQRVDRIVDTVFFRKRHEDEKAIRTFARTCAYITDAPTLLQRAAATLERHADASAVTFELADGAGWYGEVSENDPAIVLLRADGEIVDLHTVQTALQGEFAYPMIARGRLIGALVLGRKRSGESYAPDESDAVLQLAHSTGTALDVLREHAGGSDVTAAVTLLAAKIDAHFAALPGQIASAMRGEVVP